MTVLTLEWGRNIHCTPAFVISCGMAHRLGQEKVGATFYENNFAK